MKIFKNILFVICAAMGGAIFVYFYVSANFSAPSENPPSGGGVIGADVNAPRNSLYISGAGNIGVGTTTPSFPLEIFLGSNVSPGLKVSHANGRYLLFGGDWPYINSFGARLLLNSSSNEDIDIGNSDVYVANSSNFVGIGTSSPNYKLDIVGALRLQPINSTPSSNNGVIYYDSNLNKFRCYQAGSWYDCIITSTAPVNNYWLFSGTDKLYVSSTAWNVGIGTTTPQYKLDVVGGPIRAAGGLILETRTGSDPVSPVVGQMWLRTDL
jgi:hypothetical protein